MTTWTNFTRTELRDDASNPDYVQTCKLRRAACAFLSDTGAHLKMPQLTIATATVLFHRFYAIHQIKDKDKDLTAMTCLFLAGKVEETPRKLKHVIEIGFKYLHHRDVNQKDKETEEYLQLREQVLLHEFLLLQTLGFDLQIDHPYKNLLAVVRSLKADKELAQFAWNFVNDSLRTTVCLQYPPSVVALACIYLAAKYRRSILGDGKKWWTEHSVTLVQLHDIARQILELYENSPDMEALRQAMDKDKELVDSSSTAAAIDQSPTPNVNPSSPANPHASPLKSPAEKAVDASKVGERNNAHNSTSNNHREHSHRDREREKERERDRDRDRDRERHQQRPSSQSSHKRSVSPRRH